MKRFVPSVVALSVLLASPLALAMSEDAENTLRSLDYYKNGVDLKTRPFKDGDSDNTVGQAPPSTRARKRSRCPSTRVEPS